MVRTLDSTHWLARVYRTFPSFSPMRGQDGNRRFVVPAVAAEPLRLRALVEIDALGERVLVDRSLQRRIDNSGRADPGGVGLIRRRHPLEKRSLEPRLMRLAGIWLLGKQVWVMLGYVPAARESDPPVRYPGRMEEKSPFRISGVSTVANDGAVMRELYPSKFDMKNSRFLPLNSFGMLNRSAQCVAVLVLAVGCFPGRGVRGAAGGRGEVVIPGVELVVAQEFEHGAVVFIGAGFGGNVDLPGCPAELRGIDPGLDLELLQGIDRRLQNVGVEIDVGVGDAVQRVVLPGRARRPTRRW